MEQRVFYSRSLEAKLRLCQESIPVYQQLKDVCAVHKHLNSRVSFHKDTISYKRKKVAIIKMSKRFITIYLALDPSKYSEYNVKDVSHKKSYSACPTKLTIKSNRALNRACYLLEEAILAAGAKKLKVAELVDYSEVYASKSFDELLEEKKIKKYVGSFPSFDNKLCTVNFTCNLVYKAKGQAEELYIVTNTSNWDFEKAIKMEKVDENSFTATAKFPKNTVLEFKVSRSKNWNGIERGIWNEEVRNHTYVVESDLDVVDFVHNF